MGRHSSHDGDRPEPNPNAGATPNANNPNVFDDEYALDVDVDEDDFMPSVSDGFRPPTNTARDGGDGPRHDYGRDDASHPQYAATKAQPGQESDLRRLATRNSTIKPPVSRDSIAHDARHAGTHARGPSSPSVSLQHRASVSSTASFATMTRSESPLGTGPSHPYGMYPQNTMARTASIATTSTARAPHRSMSLQRPAHPYAMYSQNVVVDDDDVEPPVMQQPAMPPLQTSIPLGFPGIASGYHRQIGPDGEEQDIIGPDGHTEQLPPYSRYPEEGPTKAAMAAEASATPVDRNQNPFEPPYGSANYEPASDIPTSPSPPSPVSPSLPALNAARLPPQRPETQTGGVAERTAANVPVTTSLLSASEEGVSEKEEPVQKTGGWRSKKLWGKVPIGVALVLLLLLLIFAIILGAALGTFVAKNKGKDKGPKHDEEKPEEPIPQITGPSGSLFDATPIPTPSSLPPLPTGGFSLPLGIPQESSPGCLVQPNQLSAWSCKMTFAPLMITVNTTGGPMASMEAFDKPQGTIQYGLQPPSLIVQPMQLVTDLDYKAFGPAYHFIARYDKIVVLKSDEFAAGAAYDKRQVEPPPFRHRFQVLPGDTPWYCYWNQTYIEGYIYVQDNSTAASFTSFPSAWPSDIYGTSIPFATSTPSTAADTPLVNTATPSASPTPNVKARGDDGLPRMAPYPRVVKIEERRLPQSPQPYCQKMRLLDSGQVTPATDGNEYPIIIKLQVDDPSYADFYDTDPLPTTTSDSSDSSDDKRKRDLKKRRDPANACHCQWMFQ
ncbi:hypothetical protein BS50DRAFT_390080 [Corynespora cassiicola Philippines]|uniref:DUF7820 domain-containing protein n=1 Tax=Corynespora cassiicola Philippines TaxID=1448308 RepID=A0A2T2NPJ1_CORCC|nr:hypothetical protein BS50DRAFT_390080 [Corynespora cassiicola Philippines]